MNNEDNHKNVRVRYAPSPTGFLHIGNAQSALFNYLFARHFNGTMVLRIEDTDSKRNVPHGEESQKDNLKWLGIDWDEGPDKPNPKYAPYRQSERTEIYSKYIEKLLKEGVAYKDYTTEDELEEMRNVQKAHGEAPHYDGRWYGRSAEDQEKAAASGLAPSVRLHLPPHYTYSWNDIAKGHVSFDSDNMGGDFIIQKSNGIPTYNFAVVVDDHLMDITHVLRGDDHIANTPKQIAIYEALGWTHPNFCHISLIYNPKTRKKLSKRDKDTLQFISEYKRQGYLSDAIFNFIAFLGWSPVGEDEIFSRDELIKRYDPNRMSKSPAYFNQDKLDWMNAEYIRKDTIDDLVDKITELINEGETEIAKKLQKLSLTNLREFIYQVTKIYQNESYKLTDIMKHVDFYANVCDQHMDLGKLDKLSKGDTLSVLNTLSDKIKKLKDSPDDEVDFKKMIDMVSAETGISGRKLYFPLNISFTGNQSAPQINEIMNLYSYSTILKLLNNSINYLQDSSVQYS